MNVFKLLSIGLFLFSAQSFASRSNYLYQGDAMSQGQGYLNLLSSVPTDDINKLAPDKKELCEQRYSNILNDGLIDIRIAIGYFDWTIGTPIVVPQGNYGLSPSIDIGTFAALRDLLMTPCRGNLRFCGFTSDSKNPYLFTRDVVVQGRKIQARLEMHFSSATEYLQNNLGQNRDDQTQRTAFMDSFFNHALKEADAVFYYGHSRNGGGPDFSPPVFIKGMNKVDYKGYYQVVHPGLKKLLAGLDTTHQPSMFGLMSCDSRDHFLNTLRTVAPHTGIITSTSVLHAEEVYTAMIGAVDSLLRGQCQQSFYRELRMTPRNQDYITMDGMFE